MGHKSLILILICFVSFSCSNDDDSKDNEIVLDEFVIQSMTNCDSTDNIIENHCVSEETYNRIKNERQEYRNNNFGEDYFDCSEYTFVDLDGNSHSTLIFYQKLTTDFCE